MRSATAPWKPAPALARFGTALDRGCIQRKASRRVRSTTSDDCRKPGRSMFASPVVPFPVQTALTCHPMRREWRLQVAPPARPVHEAGK